MNRKNQNKRREFLNNVCPTVAMAFLGVSLLESCSSGDGDVDNGGGNMVEEIMVEELIMVIQKMEMMLQ